MKQKVAQFFQAHSYRNTYIIFFLLASISYYFVRSLMIDMSAWGFIMTSQLTFNIILLFGLWGGLHHLIVPVKNPYGNVVVLVVGFVVIVIFLRFIGGLPTIFG